MCLACTSLLEAARDSWNRGRGVVGHVRIEDGGGRLQLACNPPVDGVGQRIAIPVSCSNGHEFCQSLER